MVGHEAFLVSRVAGWRQGQTLRWASWSAIRARALVRPMALLSRPQQHLEVAVGTAPRGALMCSQATG
ncbi:hypothetical protein SNA_15285 [Streptomyces natalensis ATCC 27448]|uniref:Uncharacterized protein n=1 Tax=Streptomyces natalensis ATCC 27448 TaxID=1240678 RepID=A0A0D7CMS3_9ACTN|nr:hypothetical protein SNA_15285 [Streptomyces natalensis ATCC 27448]